ncbi:MAG TPA: hypothetical protein VM680_10545 [Verrucomicrobiae bacterium]|nr:hypothetical protein [Verrucomicrobiae bacterium]
MNTEEKQTRVTKLEQLSPEQQTWIFETALNSSLVDITVALREHGIHTSPASISRFMRKDRERRLLEDKKETREAAAALAEGASEGKLREGTLEAVRHRLYERALVSQSPEEALELYGAMVKEEARLRELELEARKVAALEQQVKLQGLRVEVEVSKARQARGVKEAEVVGSAPVAIGELTQGAEPGDPNVAEAERQRLRVVLREVNEIANRGGPVEEKFLELRLRLAAEIKEIGAEEGIKDK